MKQTTSEFIEQIADSVNLTNPKELGHILEQYAQIVLVEQLSKIEAIESQAEAAARESTNEKEQIMELSRQQGIIDACEVLIDHQRE